MTDIVERLEKNCPCSSDIGCADALCLEAAAEITRLRTENERLRALLDRIAEELSQAGVDDCESGVKWLNERAAENYLKDYRHTKAAIGTVIDLARAALKENSE